MKNSVEKFNALNGQTVTRNYIEKLRTQAFDEQQFEVFKRLSALEEKYPDAENFVLEIDTPVVFDKSAHGGMGKPNIKKTVAKVKATVKRKTRKIAKKAIAFKNDEDFDYASLGIPYLSATDQRKLGPVETRTALGKVVNSNNVYQMVTDRIISAIETHGDLTWYNGRNNEKGKDAFVKLPLPINYNIAKYYRGINALILSHYPIKTTKKVGNIKVPFIKLLPITDGKLFWLTFSQIKKNNGKLKKGSTGLEAVYYNFIYKNGNKVISETTYNKLVSQFNCKAPNRSKKCAALKKIPFLRYYKVFNERDIQGIDFEKRRKQIDKKAIKFDTETEKIEAAEAIIKAMPKRPQIIERHIGKGESPNYQPTTDKVVMPFKKQYDNVAIWYGTAFHELIHATGHETRLKRVGIVDFDRFGSAQYAFEELVAELGSAFLNAESGILFHTLKKNAAYIKGWKKSVVSILKEDNKAIFKASGQAQKAADFILDKNAKGKPKYLEIKPVKQPRKKRVNPSKPKTKNQLALFGKKSKPVKKLGTVMIDISAPTIATAAVSEGAVAVAPLAVPPVLPKPEVQKQVELPLKNNPVSLKQNLVTETGVVEERNQKFKNLKQLGFQRANEAPKEAKGVFKLPGEIGEFLQLRQPHKELILIKGTKHTSKSQIAMQIANAYGEKGDVVCYIDYEQGGLESKDTINSVKWNTTQQGVENVLIIGSLENPFEDLKNFCKHSKVIVADSVTDLKISADELNELRNGYTDVSWIFISQVKENGSMYGGNKMAHNPTCIIDCHPSDDPKKRYATLEKNRGNDLSLAYSIFHKKIINLDDFLNDGIELPNEIMV